MYKILLVAAVAMFAVGQATLVETIIEELKKVLARLNHIPAERRAMYATKLEGAEQCIAGLNLPENTPAARIREYVDEFTPLFVDCDDSLPPVTDADMATRQKDFKQCFLKKIAANEKGLFDAKQIETMNSIVDCVFAAIAKKPIVDVILDEIKKLLPQMTHIPEARRNAYAKKLDGARDCLTAANFGEDTPPARIQEYVDEFTPVFLQCDNQLPKVEDVDAVNRQKGFRDCVDKKIKEDNGATFDEDQIKTINQIGDCVFAALNQPDTVETPVDPAQPPKPIVDVIIDELKKLLPKMTHIPQNRRDAYATKFDGARDCLVAVNFPADTPQARIQEYIDEFTPVFLQCDNETPEASDADATNRQKEFRKCVDKKIKEDNGVTFDAKQLYTINKIADCVFAALNQP